MAKFSNHKIVLVMNSDRQIQLLQQQKRKIMIVSISVDLGDEQFLSREQKRTKVKAEGPAVRKYSD